MMVYWLVLSLLLVLAEVHGYKPAKEVRNKYQDTGIMSVLSPRYPDTYDGAFDIRWEYNITYATGLKIDVHALDLAPVKRHCYDKLQLWHYTHDNIGAKTALCGSHVSELAKKSYTFAGEPGYGAYLEIHFESDQYSKNGAFNLSVTPLCDTEIDASSGSGVVTSPLYPRHYPSQLTCRHVIRASEGRMLQLDVVDVEMEEGEGGSCSGRDHVTMTSLMPDGRETAANVICGADHATQYVSDTGAAVVEFVSKKGAKNSRGFKISYMEVDKTTTTDEPASTTSSATTTTEEATTTTTTIPSTTTETTTTEQQTTTANDTDVAIVPIGGEFGSRMQGGELLENNNSSSSSTTVIVVILLCIVIIVCITAFLVVRRRRDKLNNNMLFDIPVTFSALNTNGDLPPVPTSNQEEIRRENPYVEIPVEGCGGGGAAESIYHEVGGSSNEVDDISRIKQNFSKVYVEVPPLPEKNAAVTERLNNKCVKDDDDDTSFVKCHPVAKPRSANNSQVTQMKTELMKGYQRYTAAPTCDGDGEDSDDVFTPSTSARSSYRQQNNSNASAFESQPSSVYGQPRALIGSESCDRQQDAIKSSTMVPMSPEAIDGTSGAGPSTSSFFPLPHTDDTSTYDQVREKPLRRESDYCMMKRSHDNLLTIDSDEGKANNESVYVKMNHKNTTSSESSSSTAY